jgi:hypothetical protein
VHAAQQCCSDSDAFNFTPEVPDLNPDRDTQALPVISTNIFLRISAASVV